MAIGTPTGSEYNPSPINAATRACSVPTGTSNDDLLIAYCFITQDDAAATGFTVNSGIWQQTGFARKSTSPTIGRSAVLWKVWNTGDPTSYTFSKASSSTSGTFGVVMVRVPGGDSTLSVNPLNSDRTSVGTALPCPQVIVPSGLADNAAVIRFYHTYYSNAGKVNTDTLTPPPGFTEVCDQSDDWGTVGAAYLMRGAGTEALGNATAAGSQSGVTGRGISLVVAPVVTAPTGPEPGRFLLAY